jgi:hypothetical protein
MSSSTTRRASGGGREGGREGGKVTGGHRVDNAEALEATPTACGDGQSHDLIRVCDHEEEGGRGQGGRQ